MARRILVIDDESSVVEVCTEMLEMKGLSLEIYY